jgi:hypothetical protein
METVADNNATVRYIKPIQIQDLIKAIRRQKGQVKYGLEKIKYARARRDKGFKQSW